jgi:hypothetical protein
MTSQKSALIYEDSHTLFASAAKSLSLFSNTTGLTFRMSAFGGDSFTSTLQTELTFFNDLEALTALRSIPKLRHIHVWWSNGSIAGIHTYLSNGTSIAHGTTPKSTPTTAAQNLSSASMTCKADEHIIAVKLFSARRKNSTRKNKTIACIRLITSAAEVFDFWNPDEKYVDVETFTATAPGSEWGLVGFYGEHTTGESKKEAWACDGDAATVGKDNESDVAVFERLGAVWGKI